MIIHQDCYNKNYIVNFYIDNIEIIINFIPEDNYNRSKLYFDVVVYYQIDNTIIEYNDNVFHNEEELKKFLNVSNKSKITSKHTLTSITIKTHFKRLF